MEDLWMGEVIPTNHMYHHSGINTASQVAATDCSGLQWFPSEQTAVKKVHPIPKGASQRRTKKRRFNISSSDNLDPDEVEALVYYSTNLLTPILDPASYSFFNDPIRSTIIMKWMRYYHFQPGLPRKISKARRDLLKIRLKLQPELTQKLGSFIVTKFDRFLSCGLIIEDENNHTIRYHPDTDGWLSRYWNGSAKRPSNTYSLVTVPDIPQRVPVAPMEQSGERHGSQPSTTEEFFQQLLEPEALAESSSSGMVSSVDPQVHLAHDDTPKRLPVAPVAPMRQSIEQHELQPSVTEEPFRQPTEPDAAAESSFSEIVSSIGPQFYPADYSIPNNVPMQKANFSPVTTKSDHRPCLLPEVSDIGNKNDLLELHQNSPQTTPSKKIMPDFQELTNRVLKLDEEPDISPNRSRHRELALSTCTKAVGSAKQLRDKREACSAKFKHSTEQLTTSRATYKNIHLELERIYAEFNATGQLLREQEILRSQKTSPQTTRGTSPTVFEKNQSEIRRKVGNIEWYSAQYARKVALEIEIIPWQRKCRALEKLAALQEKDLSLLDAAIRVQEEEEAGEQRLRSFVLTDCIDLEALDHGMLSPVESSAESLSSDSWMSR